MTRTELTRHRRNGPTQSRLAAWMTSGVIGRPSAVSVVIAVCAAVALFLRGYQLARPGYLFGVTEYDDGALFGNALRLVSGVIPYRDFSMVQPPGSMLLMVPAALLAKLAGTAWGLAAARLLTVGADTANVVLLGVLVRHRGPLAAAVACGLYAVYPDAIIAAHTFLLEPWLNLFCLAGAAAIFDGDRLVSTPSPPRPGAVRAPRLSDNARLLCGGLLFGFAAAVKIWALVPLVIAALLLVVAARRARPAAALAGGAALGLGLPLLPFAVLAPGALARGVLIGQLVRNVHGARHLPLRVADLAGLGMHPVGSLRKLLLVALAAALVGCCVAAYRSVVRSAGDRHTRALDGYSLAGAVVVTAMLLWPRLYYSHYGSFDGPFLTLALALALPIGLLTAPRPVRMRTAVAAVVLLIAAAGCLQFQAESHRYGTVVAATADRLIPAGACVVTNDAADTVSADRFYSDVPGCPEIVDSFGTFLAMTGGLMRYASPAGRQPLVDLWQTALDRAQYLWLTTNTAAQIPWNRQLFGYFLDHFRLIGFAGPPTPDRYVPAAGLYARS